MTRGTFGNIRLKNLLVPGVEGGVTLHFPDGERMSIFDAAVRYKSEGVPLIILAGAEYGTGSSRDWAAKGTLLLGVRAVIAASFERIHRSNLVGMGVLPLEFMPHDSVETLGLDGHERFDILGLEHALKPGGSVMVRATREPGETVEFKARVRIDTPIEATYYREGGILHTVLRDILRDT
jgi:aconitate hydratase